MEMIQRVTNLAARDGIKHDPTQPILELKNVSVQFENVPALKQISFHLHKGERVAVIGPNCRKVVICSERT